MAPLWFEASFEKCAALGTAVLAMSLWFSASTDYVSHTSRGWSGHWGNAETGGIAFLISLAVILSTFYTGKFLLGIGGGFKETYPPGAVPSDEELAFSWSKLFWDSLVLLGIIVVLTIIVGILKLAGTVIESP